MSSQPTIRKTVHCALFLAMLFLALPAASAAQEKIAFVSERDGNYEIYVMNPDGTNQTRLTNHSADDTEPSFSTDGRRIAFVSERDGNYEIYVMDADGSSPIRLTNDSAIDSKPKFSPDGSKIAFSSNRDGGSEIYVMNADGTNPTRLTNNTVFDAFPSFNSDGSKIAFLSLQNGNNEIYIMNADGSGQINLTNNPAVDLFPEFSPDGSKIVFYSLRDGNNEIYVMDADGSSPTRLTSNLRNDLYPSFSSDSSKIVFTSDRDDNLEIYVMDADGSSQTRLTTVAANDFFPAWGAQVNDTGAAPTISAAAVVRQEATSANAPIASLADAEQIANTLVLTATPLSGSGVTLSNIAIDASGNVTADVTASCAATDASFTLQVTDSTNQSASATLLVSVPPETTPPVMASIANLLVTLPANSSATSAVVAFPLPMATDNCSTPGVTTNPASGSVFPLGTTTVNVTATDGRGNTATGSFTVTVQYNFAGFVQPLDNLPGANVATAGSSISVKFSLSGNKGLNIFAAGFPASSAIACDATQAGGNLEATVTAGNSSLSYNANTDQYSYVWKTDKAWKGTCRMLVVKLNDGTQHLAKFHFK